MCLNTYYNNYSHSQFKYLNILNIIQHITRRHQFGYNENTINGIIMQCIKFKNGFSFSFAHSLGRFAVRLLFLFGILHNPTQKGINGKQWMDFLFTYFFFLHVKQFSVKFFMIEHNRITLCAISSEK